MFEDISKFIGGAESEIGKITKKRLSCGMTVVVIQNKSMKSFSAMLGVAVGRNDEAPAVSGVSHMLEHVVFLGTKKYPTPAKINQALFSLGGPANAETENTHTMYEAAGTVEKLPLGLDVLTQLVFFPLLRGGNAFEKERNVVLAELDEYHDSNGHLTDREFLCELHLLSGIRSGGTILGLRKNLLRMKPSDLRDHHSSFYYPENTVMVVASPESAQTVFKTLETMLPKELATGKGNNSNKLGASKIAKKPRKVLADFVSINSVTLEVYFKFMAVESRSSKNTVARQILNALLFEGEASYIFGAARQAGLVYSFEGVSQTLDEYSEFSMTTLVRGANLKKLTECLVDSVNSIFKKGINDNMFEMAKNRLKYDYVKKMQAADNYAELIMRGVLTRESTITPRDALCEIESVTSEDVVNELSKIVNAKRVAVIIGGGRLKDEYRTMILTTLRKLRAIAKQRKITKRRKNK